MKVELKVFFIHSEKENGSSHRLRLIPGLIRRSSWWQAGERRVSAGAFFLW